MHVCHVFESSFFFVWTILSLSIAPNTIVMYDAGLISFTFSRRWITEDDRNLNFIWQDWATLHARLVFRCWNMR